MTKAETITVKGFFGEKEVTKDEFIDQWLQTGGVNQLWGISHSDKDMIKIQKMRKWVLEMAKESFEESLE
ncbi:MAG TPA: hypothetical protein DCS66_15410 [Flavobacteriaceae bacterium]|nr:hypothetical protein [Flavobacteriaceae bacterium]|tara:strand:+ start:561 stop:770 length:210 start_codon:yes stop_codon:yes gene_type:complete